MKKLLLMTLLTSGAFAATTATLNLTGTIAPVVEIEINGAASASATVDLLDKTAQSVATVTETSNDADGYDITISSANSGSLNNGTADSATYTLGYGGASYNLSSVATVDNAGVVGSTDRAVTVTVTDARTDAFDFASGSYTDTVTFEITAK
ncbi:MAG: hypothetical protein VX341_03465 [Bdellovibrionota bacterium]|nr:hypothetical protein [Bdellovibrionota bacterium]